MDRIIEFHSNRYTSESNRITSCLWQQFKWQRDHDVSKSLTTLHERIRLVQMRICSHLPIVWRHLVMIQRARDMYVQSHMIIH